MEKVTEATLHLEKVTEAMAKCNLSLEYLKVTEAMAKCNLSLNYSQKIFWSDWTYAIGNVAKQKSAALARADDSGQYFLPRFFSQFDFRDTCSYSGGDYSSIDH